MCRCGAAYCLYHTGLPVCTATLRYTSGRLHFRSNCDHMASMYKHDRCLQYYSLGTHCIPSVISVLHVQVLKENTERRLDVPGRNTVVRNWYCAQQPFLDLLPWSVECLLLKVTLLLFQVLKQCLLIWGILISCQYRWINISCKLTFPVFPPSY
jgi:hypothetical protein